jgi:hypothetical protein
MGEQMDQSTESIPYYILAIPLTELVLVSKSSNTMCGTKITALPRRSSPRWGLGSVFVNVIYSNTLCILIPVQLAAALSLFRGFHASVI